MGINNVWSPSYNYHNYFLNNNSNPVQFTRVFIMASIVLSYLAWFSGNLWFIIEDNIVNDLYDF